VKQNRFVSLLLLVLAHLALISAFCVNFADCSTANTQRSNRDNLLVKRSYDQQELFEELPTLAGEEGRTFSISNISYAITYITFVVALVMLAGFMWIAFSATGGGGGYGYSNRRILPDGVSEWFSSGGNYFGFDSDYERHKRSADSADQAMASKLHMLDESFRKFEMDDIGCQMLLSCEAAQLETMKHPVYGNLTPKIHKLLSSAKKSRNSKSGQRVEKLLQAHREGRKHGASCKKLYGNLCHDLMNKMIKAEKEDKNRADKETMKGKENKKSSMGKFDMDKQLLIDNKNKQLNKKKKYRSKY